MAGQIERIYEFGEFQVVAAKHLLLDGELRPVTLTPKVFDLILYLVQNRDRVVEKDELLAAIWPDTVVEESNLTQNISILRRALGEKRGEHRYIVTIPGRGYKFVANVSDRPGADSLKQKHDEISEGSPLQPENRKAVPYFRPLLLFGLFIPFAAAAVVFLIYFSRSESRPQNAGLARKIAVLPFRPLVAENRDEVLEMGMADTLIARLGNIRGLVVRPLSSVLAIDDRWTDTQTAGQQLGVDAVLVGSIQRWGSKLRVNVRLINVADGASLWSGTYDESDKDLFGLQDAIASQVTEALKLKVIADRRNPPTQNIEAYRKYLQGRYYVFKVTHPEVRKGIAYYQRAIDIDPLYALAYAGLADAYRTLPINSDVRPKDVLPLARRAAEKALELDPELVEAHVALGWVASWYDWDSAASGREFEKAIALESNNPDAYRGYSGLLTVMGRHDEAVAEIKRATALDPLSAINVALEGQALFYAGRDEEAIEILHKVFEIDAKFWVARINLAKVYIRQGRYDDAITELRIARDNSGKNSETLSLIGYALALAGRREEALKVAEELQTSSNGSYVPPYNIAMIYNGLGNADEAFFWLEKGVEDRDVRLRLLKVDHKWDSIREDARWEPLIERTGLK